MIYGIVILIEAEFSDGEEECVHNSDHDIVLEEECPDKDIFDNSNQNWDLIFLLRFG